MSEIIDCNLSIGVSEAGKIGEDILIGILSVEKDEEICLLVNNLLYSNHLVNLTGQAKDYDFSTNGINNEIIKKYVTKIIRNREIKTVLFRLQPFEQFKLLEEIVALESQKLYELGKSIDATNYQFVGKSLQLRYQYPKVFMNTFLKSIIQYIALNWFLKENTCGHGDLFKQNIKNERKMALHTIVDGGAHYSSYQDLLNENLKNYWTTIKTTQSSKFYWNLMVATHGIEGAKKYYPVVSGIDFVLQSINSKINHFIYSQNTLQEITAEEILNQKDHLGKSLLEVLHESYLQRTGSNFRPPKLWYIGDFSDLGEYELTLPYLLLQKSIKEKKITAREVDYQSDNIERFYTYNNPLDRDAFLVGRITDAEKDKILFLKEHNIEGMTIADESIKEEYRTLLNNIAKYVQKDDCIITNEDQKTILEKIAVIEKQDLKKIEKIPIPKNLL